MCVLVGKAPKFTKRLKDTKATIPGKVKLSADVDLGKPTAEVKWFKDWKELYAGPKYGISQSKHKTELEFKEPQNNDAGKYRCLVRNALGEDECEAVLTINCMYIIYSIPLN